MKKTLVILMAFLILFSTTPVFADVIWEPEEDDFYVQHRDECVSVQTAYVAASANGATEIYVSPDDTTVVDKVSNGENIYPYWQWNDWLYIDAGWFHSDDVSAIYDSAAFFNDHEIEEYVKTDFSSTEILMYSYPNSGEFYELVQDSQYMDISDAFTNVYTDENGLEWGYIPYYMVQEGWVCLSDPMNENLNDGVVQQKQSISQVRGSDAIEEIVPIETNENPSNTPSGDEKPVQNSQDTALLIVASVLVLAVVAITVVMLAKKNKAK